MRIKQLDGIRAIAVLMVFAEHTEHLRFGWAGVDLFFVLSGYLITRILRRDASEPRYWSRFYIKRAARILPPLALCMALSALLFDLHLRWLWLAYLLFGANVAEAFRPAASGPLSVLWSLAVEEHFYLLWPLAVRYLNRRHLIYLLGALLLLEPGMRAIATTFTHTCWPVYFLTPFRLDGLAAGSLLALLLEDDATKRRIAALTGPLLCVSAATLIVAVACLRSFTREADSILFNSLGYSLVALIAASLIGQVLLHQKSAAVTLLSLRPLTFLGSISYGFYLFHKMVMLKIRGPVSAYWSARILGHGSYSASAIATFVTALALSWLSFRLYETSCIGWGHRMAERERMRYTAGRESAAPSAEWHSG
jgi:peptidoglycan/LPS O-acetylase OafA/YrhL